MTKPLKRPRDPLALAKLIGDIATGQIAEPSPHASVAPASEFARRGGQKGGKMRAEKLSAERRREIALKAAEKRWERRGNGERSD